VVKLKITTLAEEERGMNADREKVVVKDHSSSGGMI
jgi:hypothetical protein